jgi:excisionase family DNA binding protein|tara:strand:+ start:51 stop:296 length:246 start_codon:yes stop_codon:yes gene_type:complete
MSTAEDREDVPRLAFTTTEAAVSIAVSERTIRQWMKDEGLPFFRCRGTVRIPVAGFKEWIRKRMIDEKRGEAIVNQILSEL